MEYVTKSEVFHKKNFHRKIIARVRPMEEDVSVMEKVDLLFLSLEAEIKRYNSQKSHKEQEK